MTPLVWVTLGGMIMAAGVVVAVVALRPATPKLSVALARLSAAPSMIAADPAPAAPTGRWHWLLPPPVAAFVQSHLGVSDADLEIVGMTRAQLALRKVTRGGIGLLVPSLLTVLLSLGGSPIPFIFPAAVALVMAAGMWVSPSDEVKKKAARARAQFRAALGGFLRLVAQERVARGSPTEALEEASRGWQSWALQQIHAELLRAELAGQQPWDALRQMGTRLGLEELRSMAEVVSTAADGAAVFNTLLAEARNLHYAELSAQHKAANEATEKVMHPLMLLAVGFILLTLIPPLLRLFTA